MTTFDDQLFTFCVCIIKHTVYQFCLINELKITEFQAFLGKVREEIKDLLKGTIRETYLEKSS